MDAIKGIPIAGSLYQATVKKWQLSEGVVISTLCRIVSVR
jgi:hypothetical protein